METCPLKPEAGASAGISASQRHHGLDWLRICAFALLILYHIGLVFSPGHWVIKVGEPHPALIVPMALLTPWRLALLFAVSGYASRMLFERSGGPAAFMRSRNARLLVPLALGMAALIPIEMWVLVKAQGYPYSYLHFWARDYWRVGEFWGREFPSWEHLWFVAYLWTYTLLLAAVLAWGPRRLLEPLDAAIDWLAQGRRVLWVPAALLVLAKLSLLFVVPEKQGLTTDWSGHALYFPIFVAGFVLGGAPRLWPALARSWKAALALAALAGAAIVPIELAYQGDVSPPHALMALDRAANVAMAWSMTLALFHLADRFLNRDHRWRRTAAEAVFPFYLVHEPAIVLIAWHSQAWGLGAWAEFGLLLAGTLAACTAAYLLAREIRWLRPLLGLSPRPRPAPLRPAPAL